jgi:quinol monooxygenase YgiN
MSLQVSYLISEAGDEHMGRLAIVATVKTAPGKRDEYINHLKAHAERSLATEPGTLEFKILVPQKEADTVMLYELYASPEAFEAHRTGASIRQVKRDAEGLQVSITGVFCDPLE